MPAWFEASRQIVELAVVGLLAAQAVGRWMEKRESGEKHAGESMAGLRKDLEALDRQLDRRVHALEILAIEKTIERIDGEIDRQRDNLHDLRNDVQTILLQFASMGRLKP